MMSMFSSFDMKIMYVKFATLLILVNLFTMNSYLNESFYALKKTKKLLTNFLNSNKKMMFNKLVMMLMTTTFMVWATLNTMSIMPFVFSYTSQLSAVSFISLIVWTSFMMFMLTKKIKKLLSHSIPEGAPYPLAIILFFIEMTSITIRPMTITIRLVANITAGHLMMILLSKMVMLKLTITIIYMVLNLIELAVSLIQAHIYATMMTLYYSEI